MDLIDPKSPLFNKEGWILAQTSAVQAREKIFLGKNPTGKGKLKLAKVFKERTRIVLKLNTITIEISNKVVLTQDHRDLLDIIFRYVRYDTKSNKVIANVPLKEIKKRINSTTRSSWLKEKLQDLREVVFYMTFIEKKDNKKYRHLTNFNIIEFFDKVDRIDFDGKDARENMVHIIIDPGYIIFFSSDIAINYSITIMDEVIAVKDKAVKSVVRYCLSQKQYVHENLFKILTRFGFTENDFKDSSGRKLKRRFEKAKETLKKFNIEYDKKSNLIKYVKKGNGVYHYVPDGNTFLENLEKYKALPHHKEKEITED